MARTLRSVIIAFAVLIVVVLAASGIALAWFWRERRQVRELLSAEKGQPTEVVLKRMLRQRVHRDELAAVLFSREAVLEATPLPVLILDGEGRVVRVNAAARVALGGVDIGGLAAELAPELGHAISGVLSGPPVDQVEMVAGAERRVWLAHLRSHPDADGRAAVAVLVDVTEDVDFREARRLFSAAVSHELRTPLQRIVGLVDTLALPLSDGERAELVQAAEHEVQRMRELVDEMLLLAALDRGQAALSEGDCDASAVAERVVASRVVRARQSGMTLRIDAAAGLRVPIGEQLLEVVIGNVVDNALKYAGSGAEVEVGVRGRAGEVEIAVSDTGVGIAPEHLPHVFERFFRGEQARSSPGSGLGLAVVKHIVEAHGGRARAESRAGEGAVGAPRAPRGLRRQRVVTRDALERGRGGLGRVDRLLEPVVQRLRAHDLERLGSRGEEPRERIADELVALVLERVEVGDLGLEVRAPPEALDGVGEPLAGMQDESRLRACALGDRLDADQLELGRGLLDRVADVVERAREREQVLAWHRRREGAVQRGVELARDAVALVLRGPDARDAVAGLGEPVVQLGAEAAHVHQVARRVVEEIEDDACGSPEDHAFSRRFGREAVPDAEVRLEVAVGRLVVDLLAQLAHAHVDGAVARAVRDVPDALLQLVPAHRLAGVLGEHEQQPELGRRQHGIVPLAAVVDEERALLVRDRSAARAPRSGPGASATGAIWLRLSAACTRATSSRMPKGLAR